MAAAIAATELTFVAVLQMCAKRASRREIRASRALKNRFHCFPFPSPSFHELSLINGLRGLPSQKKILGASSRARRRIPHGAPASKGNRKASRAFAFHKPFVVSLADAPRRSFWAARAATLRGGAIARLPHRLRLDSKENHSIDSFFYTLFVPEMLMGKAHAGPVREKKRALGKSSWSY